jgi:ribA/ribD-fused uncharacterized protein
MNNENPAPATPTAPDERAAFEAWFTRDGNYEPEHLYFSRGMFMNGETQNMFEAFRAGRAALASPAAPTAEPADENLREIMRAVFRELEAGRDWREDGNAPGHAHDVPGIWDSDNGKLAGKPCAWCALWKRGRAALATPPAASRPPDPDLVDPSGALRQETGAVVDRLRGLDTAERVRFYEHDFYPLSNFSAFTLEWKDRRFDTSEAAYHWEKFVGKPPLMTAIQYAPSAHEAFKVAERNKVFRRPDWDDVKVGIMRDILRAKVDQHEYVRRKLLATGTRELVEDSWRDDFWGWGPNRDGQNMLGKLWMELRAELVSALPSAPKEPTK